MGIDVSMMIDYTQLEVKHMTDKEYSEFKIEVPIIPQRVLHRHAISQIIDCASLDEIIYLVAPYGCGKTLSVISWLRERNKKTAWFSLSKADNSSVSFWAHISAAILRFAGNCDKVEDILNNIQFIENPRMYFAEMLKRISPAISDRVLVIDNFKFVQNKGLLLEIRDLIHNMLNCWRIIIIGRNELPPIFNDFILKRHLRLITLNELNFSLDEMNEYFIMNGLTVDSKDLIQIRKDTDGWPAALNVILSVQHNGAISFNNYAKAYVKEFFEVEVWEQISDDEIRTFLLKTSVLDKLTHSVCLHVTEIEEADRILRYLYANGIFISKLDEVDSYCYHLVFRDFLLDKLRYSGIDIKKLYLKAGWWLYERNESISALTCFHKADNIHGINKAFKKIRPANLGMEKYLDAALCLTSLNVAHLKDYPSVAVRIALLHFITDNILEMQRIYEIVIEWLEPGALLISPEEYIDFNWEVGWLRYINPNIDIIFNKVFDDWVNVQEYAPHLQENDRSRSSSLWLPSVLCGVRDYSVEIDRAEEYYNLNLESESGAVRDEIALFIMDLIIAEMSYEREDFSKAEKIIKKIMPQIEKAKLTELYFTCTVLLVKISRASHRTEEIDALTSYLKTLIENNNHLFLMQNFHAFELRNRLAKGIPGLSEIFMAENEPYISRSYYYLIYRQVTYVRALLSEGKYREANLLLGKLEFLCRQYKRNIDLIEINILYSIAEYGLDHIDSAYHHIKKALKRGRKSGLIRIFSDDAEGLWPILCLIHKYELDTYKKKVIISCKKMIAYSQVTSLDKNEHEPLTKAEIGILKLLQAGMTNDEIMIHNNVKMGTVKNQLHSIYTKLDVEGRSTAIIKAKKLGILDINP